MARWLTTDPAGFADSVNLYQYVFNQPFRYVDPDGQFVMLAIPLLIWGAELILPTIAAIATPVIYGVVAGTAVWAGYKAVEALNTIDYNSRFDFASYSLNFDDSSEQNKEKVPPYDGRELGNDPTKKPAEGFEWKGSGAPGSGRGSWVKGSGKTKEILYRDLEHPPPKKPHWDYIGPEFPKGTRQFLDGTWELKS